MKLAIYINCINDIHFKEDHLLVNVKQSETDVDRNGSEIVIAKGTIQACHSILQRYVTNAKIALDLNNYLFRPCFRQKHFKFSEKKDKKWSYTRTR
jgi:hypothetical protein